MIRGMETLNKTSLIFHGHFYQPPRENPLTGIIPKQPSAKPYSDWNERISSECYAANTDSRYLDKSGRIVSITNNFEFLSYNFGATLLSWLYDKQKDVYEKIIEADHNSIIRLGHGNAMAQGFNHSILPLDPIRAAKHQILWGLDDFSSRYQRGAEGMWLPEAAINPTVVQLLCEAGVKFVVLSPWQCKSIEGTDRKMVDLNGTPAPFDKPFILDGANGGSVVAYFYNPTLAEGISFGHLLRDADNLYATLQNIKKDFHHPDLINVATDGEIYGHHEPYGDMALAALIRKVRDRDEFTLTNYASFLEQHPAVLHAELHKGEEEKGTSWSCSHGVSRWYKDCGCHTGGEPGWNQKWRTPLRIALNNNADRLSVIFDSRIKQLFKTLTPDELLNQYGMVACQAISMKNFMSDLEEKYPEIHGHTHEIAAMLEGIKNKHYSFTSCGWFFNDLAGLEPEQNIAYALYAINLFQQYSQEKLLPLFLKDLQKAKSNDPTKGDGMSIAQKILKEIPGEVEACLYFILNQRIAEPELKNYTYGRYQLLNYTYGDDFPQLNIFDTISLRTFEVSTIIGDGNSLSSFEFYMAVRNMDDNTIQKISVNNANIPPRMLDEAYSWIEHSLSIVGDMELIQIARNIAHYSMLSKNSKYLPMATLFIENIGTCLRALRSHFYTPNTLKWNTKKESIKQLIEFIKKRGRMSEIEAIEQIFSEESRRIAQKIKKDGLSQTTLVYTINFISLTLDEKIEMDQKSLQDSVYPYVIKKIELDDSLQDEFTKLKKLLNFV